MKDRLFLFFIEERIIVIAHKNPFRKEFTALSSETRFPGVEKSDQLLAAVLAVIGAILGTAYIVMDIAAKSQKTKATYQDKPEERNPMEGKKVVFVENENDPINADGLNGHLESVGDSSHIPTVYEVCVKRGIDKLLSFLGMVILSPVYAVTALAIKADDPGPVLFKQKRVGQNKQYFELLKFRSMSVNTPKDVPTHMLQNGGITRVGAFIRKTSIDELPQLWNTFRGDMSIIGPRPALWNQDFLTAERDKYDANDIKPGLTGLAQISGRDELEIPDKAKLDGVYAKELSNSNVAGFCMDMKMFFGSIFSVLKREGIVEGGTGALAKEFAKIKTLSSDTVQINNPPLVSVVIATYRRNDTLGRAIKSVIKQTYPNIEIIIVDDNADENWNEIVRHIVTKYQRISKHRIIYVKNKKNEGSAKTRNIGIDKANGFYITFLDDDDEYLPYKIEKQTSMMISQKADYSITDLNLYYENGELCEKRKRNYLKDNGCNNLLFKHLKYHMTGTDTMMFTKEYLLQIGGFEPIDIGDEYYLMSKAIQANGKLTYIAESDVKAYVHIEENGLSSGIRKINGENDLYNYKKAFFDSLSKSDIRYIKMRHHAVLAFAYKRSGRLTKFFSEGICSFLTSPLNCLKLINGLK